LKQFSTKESKVSKLFAKHIKISEAIDMCKATRYVVLSKLFRTKTNSKRMTFGVGTPKRISDLLDDGRFGRTNCELVLIVYRSSFGEALETDRNRCFLY
jgi:protein CMS1